MNAKIIDYGRIQSVADLVKNLSQNSTNTKSHAHKRVWYRGHSDQIWKLQPSVYREHFLGDIADVDTELTADQWERHRINKERHMSQDFRVLSAAVRTKSKTEADIYFLQQHYGMPTRLLDWTTNPLAGLFFAVSANPNQDGKLYVLDAYKFTEKVRGLSEGIATSRNDLFTEALKIIVEWRNDIPWKFGVLPVRPDHIDIRMGLQQSCFTFHGPGCPLITEDAETNRSLGYMMIPSSYKSEIRKQLLLLGIDQFSIFGDLEHLARRLMDNYAVG